MAHFIQPIEIESADYCCKCYGTTAALGRGTKGIKTDSSFAINGHANTADITNDCSPWDLLDGTAGAAGEEEGEITFGVSCGTTVEIDLDMGFFPQGLWFLDVDIYIDGVLDSTESFTWDDPTFAARSVTLTDVPSGPCGSLITLHAFSPDPKANSGLEITAEVTSIT